jgi:putative hydrolase of the HAD superfamily
MGTQPLLCHTVSSGATVSPSAVVWDLGGVLISMDWPAAAAHWEPRLGLRTGDLLRCLFGGNDNTVLIGKVSEDEWWDTIAQRIGTSLRDVQVLRADLSQREAFDAELLQVVRDLRPIARQAIVSNSWGGTRERLRVSGVDHLFDEIVISAEVGAAKPAREIYQTAWERLRLPPSSCLLIDDTIENVAAAAALGMTGYVHRSASQTSAWLWAVLGDG